MHRKLVALILLLAPTLAYGGGDHFPVYIKELRVEPDFSFIFTAEPNIKECTWEENDCNLITVEGFYDHKKWSTYKRPMSFALHKDALNKLLNAKESKHSVRLGYIGLGLLPIGKCRYKSRGLFLDQDKVFSVHESI